MQVIEQVIFKQQIYKMVVCVTLVVLELHNQKYERKRGYSVSTPKGTSRASENRISQAEGARKKRAAAISAGKKSEERKMVSR